ncbi:MAG: mechanosensitive ion channel family protein, partial [Chitinophagaceae bacterium]
MPQRSNKNRFLRQQPAQRASTATRARTAQRKVRNKRLRRQRGSAVKGAQSRLKQFRQASILAVAVTGLLLMLLTPGEAGLAQDENDDTTLVEERPDSVAIIEGVATEDLVGTEDEEKIEEEEPGPFGKAATDEAIGTLRNLWNGLYSNLPKILVAIGALFFAWLFARFFKFLLRKLIGHWESSGAVITLVVIAVWLFSIGVALSVVAGDIRALVGSLGLIGLALSWSLQTPIESFTGWL